MKLKPILLAVAATLALPAFAQNAITVVNFGGANGAAQKKAYFEPFEKAGGKVTQVEYNGEQAKIKAMVEAKNVTWDVVEVEGPDINRGCDEGLFEKMDWAKLGNKADFQKAAVHECGVGTFVWSTVMAFDGDKLKTAIARTDPLVAPLSQGQRVGTLEVTTAAGTKLASVPLVVLQAVPEAGLLGRAWDSIRLWIK